MQTPSLVPERTDFVIVDTENSEVLKVEWLTPFVTKNTLGEECWLYDGEETSPCEV